VERLLEAAVEPSLSRIRQDRVARASSARVKRLLTYLEDHLLDPELTIGALKLACGIRDNSISSVFGSELGDPPQLYLKNRRMETAARLLRDTDLKIWQIAEMICFANPASFSTAFREWSGRSPKDYREHARSAAAPPLDDDLLNAQVLRRALDGEAEPDQLRRMIGRLRAFEPAEPEAEPSPGPPSLAIDGAKIERGLALVFWEELRYRPAEEQTRMVRRPNGLCSPALFDVLRDKSREEGRKDRQAGIQIAELALASLEGVAPYLSEERLANQKAWGMATVANAKRLALDLLAADRLFQQAERTLPADPEPRVVAEIRDLESSLCLDQGRFEDALDLVEEATATFRTLGDVELVAKGLVHRAVARGCAQTPGAAIPDLLEALKLLEDSSERSYLRLTLFQNLLTAYVLSGQTENARKWLCETRVLGTRLGDGLGCGQLLWIEGHLEKGCGDLTATKQCLRLARERFMEIEEVAHSAAVSLDLAEVCLQQSQTSEALAWASAAIPVFEELRIVHLAAAGRKLLREIRKCS
jgi:AraC-like DNA-binding protein